MTEPDPLSELAAATVAAPTTALLGELAHAVAGKDMAMVVCIAVELGRRVERGELAEQDARQPLGQRRPRRIDS